MATTVNLDSIIERMHEVMSGLCMIITLSMLSGPIVAQTQRSMVENPAFDQTIRQYLDFTIPVISCQDLRNLNEDYLLLDAREWEEYEVSHLPGAQHIGYKKVREDALKEIPKDQKIIVYCSIGYRSEKVGERLREMGYQDVSNLYGSIFEWINQGLPVVDQKGLPTRQLHTYNRSWSKWVENEKVEKEW